MPEGSYDSAIIEEAPKSLPEDVRLVAVEAIRRASAESKRSLESLELKIRIAEFATALHLLVANENNQDYKVDLINWDHFAHATATNIIRLDKTGLKDIIPDTVRKMVAHFYVGFEVMRDATRDELDEVLDSFGYPTSRILDDLVTESLEKGSKKSPEDIRREFESVFARLFFQQDYPDLEKRMREELLAVGYQLPKLKSDKSYGYSDEEGDIYPTFTTEMLPA
ncbi:hypothetical protein EYC58_04965 [Candidatus Saccharibacteria bacterium]|nr:MAG: hypothetical protein EYC58_04965 [Candidatus Saccharibacteria bacterium]